MRLKDISILSPRYNGPRTDAMVAFVPMEGLRSDRIEQQEITIEEGSSKYTYFADNDLLIAKVTPCFENGNIAVAKELKGGIGFGSSEIFVLRFNKESNPRFMYYVAQSSEFQKQACATMCGVGGLKRISPLFMRTYEFDVPSKDVQDSITSYLDDQSELINKCICLRERELQTLIKLKQSEINSVVTCGLNPSVPLKDSGVDWIGDIPAHWQTIRLKDVSYLYGGLTGKAGDDFRCEDLSMTKPFIPFTNILNNTVVDFSNFKQVVMTEGEDQNRVRENDILFLMSSEDYESIGKTAIVLGDPGEVYLNSFCRGLRFTKLKDVYPKFVNYLLLSDKYRDALRFEARGFTRINLKIDKISSLSIALPPLDEQKAIVEYLDNKYESIDAYIANINAQIDKLKLLKKSLINEVISGQRPVI